MAGWAERTITMGRTLTPMGVLARYGVAVGLVAACGPAVDVESTSAAVGSTSASAGSSAGSTGLPTSTSTSTSSSTQDQDETAGLTTTANTSSSEGMDVDLPPDCDFAAQDCPDGYKCTWVAGPTGLFHGERGCVEVAPEPDAVDEPCTHDEPKTGLDGELEAHETRDWLAKHPR